MARRSRSVESGASLFACARPSDESFEPRVLAGVDEAGFGPLLGPLTIGCIALRVADVGTPSAQSARDPWERLASVVARAHERDGEPARLVVGDSKAVFERNARGRERLERTVLAFHAVLHGWPDDGRAFLAATAPPLACPTIEAEFWHAAIARRLSAATEESLAAGRSALADGLGRAGLQLVECAVRAVPPATLNASFARTGSKGATHWEECAPFFAHLWNAYGTEVVELVVDRHGGRMRYAGLLATTFAGATVETESEIAARSIYLLRDDAGRRMRVTFAEKADALSFAVALASCCAKYARELCMDAFNAHFARLQPELEPTAGYVTDARRWLADAIPALARAGLAPELLVRTR
jgi:ribonuclease HII